MIDNNTSKMKHFTYLIKEYEKLVYEKSHISLLNDFFDYVCEQENIENAIKISVMSKNRENKIFPHQRRLKSIVLENYANILINTKDKIQNSKNFDELFNILNTNKISGIAELTLYDIALRIGQYLKLFPEYIYIHAGTRIGLKNLLGVKMNKSVIGKNELLEPFCSCNLNPMQLEDFFCYYKNEIKMEY